MKRNMGQLINLIEQIKNGDKDKFSVVIEKFDPLIRKYTRLLYKEESEDVRGELVLALWEAIVSLEYIVNEGQTFNYLSNALRNTFFELYRKSKKSHNHEICVDDDMLYIQPYIESEYDNAIIEIVVNDFLGKYDGRLYEIYYLIMVEYLSDCEIADRLKISRQYVNRQRKLLKKKLLRKFFSNI